MAQHRPAADTSVTAVIGEILDRVQLDATAEKYSGATIEGVRTPEGTFVLKALPAEGDWLTRGTDGAGRLRRLWEDGVLGRAAPLVERAVVAILPTDRGDTVVLRDVSNTLLPPRGAIGRATAERVLAGLAAMHAAFEGITVTGCSIAARLALFAPRRHADDTGPNPHPARQVIVQGWGLFEELTSPDLSDAMAAVHCTPQRLAGRLEASAPATLLHGDAKPENLGITRHRLVAIDWGELTGTGPAATDVAWFAIQAGWRLDMTPAEVFDCYQAHAGRRLDVTALDLACIGALAQMGFKLAFRAAHGSDEAVRRRATTLLSWWTARATAALNRTSPL